MNNKELKNLLDETIDELDKLISLEESTLVRIDNNARRQAMLNRAILAAAKENQDPLYYKYIKTKKRFLYLRELLRQRYHAKGKAKLGSYDF